MRKVQTIIPVSFILRLPGKRFGISIITENWTNLKLQSCCNTAVINDPPPSVFRGENDCVWRNGAMVSVLCDERCVLILYADGQRNSGSTRVEMSPELLVILHG